MSYYDPDVYYQPEKFGLTPVKEMDVADSWEFDIIVVWKHEDGRWFVGNDSGCSCPSPFEYRNSLDDLTEVWSVHDVEVFAKSCGHYWNDNEVAALCSGLEIP